MRPDLIHFIRLSLIEGIGPVNAKKLIAHRGGAEEVFKSSRKQLLSIDGIGPSYVDKILSADTARAADALLETESKAGNNIFCYLDKAYPRRLNNCEDAPLLIFTQGEVDLNQAYVLSIVGTRHATEYGTRATEDFIKAISPLRPLIVIGLAHGIDVAAHKAAMRFDCPTVGVLAHGLDMVYPAIHRKVADRMCEQGGLISEFPIGIKPDKERFPMRNRIVAGMSDATVVVESDVSGGSLITARMANDYARDVFAIPGRVTDRFSRGTNDLIRRDAAHLLDDPDEFMKMMGWELNKKEEVVQTSMFIELGSKEKSLVAALSKDPRSVDVIAVETAMPMSEVNAMLLGLEFKGMVRALPGKRYALA
jgi:DNA processing protein